MTSRVVFLSLLTGAFLASCASDRSVKKSNALVLDELSIPTLPEWTDRYADGKKGDVRFFNITRLMTRYGLDRLQAVELQNQYRDLTRQDVTLVGESGFNRALESVRGNHFESNLKRDVLAKARFVVVFDLDETLYDQYYDGGETCNTHAFKEPNGTTKYVYMVPGWEKLIKSIQSLGGTAAIFSANLDERTIRLLSHVTIDGHPLTNSPLIAGVMTNSFLVQQEKTEPPGSVDKPRNGRPVIEPSKDLRFFDETLSKVIIVDDNPLRLFQFRNARVFKKFHADAYCQSSDAVFKRAVEGGMAAVESEIRWAVARMDADPNLTFVDAYLPFTVLGQLTVNWLMSSHGFTPEQAQSYVVENPKSVDGRF